MRGAGRACLLAAAWVAALGTAAFGTNASAEIAISLTYLRQEVEAPPVLSNLDPVPEDLGIAGAEVALTDTKTTGRFLGHLYSLDVVSVAPGGDLAGAAKTALAAASFLLLDAPANDILKIADLPEAAGKLIFNVASGERRLRDGDCRANLLHTIPEDAMRADALMQVLKARRWTRTALIVGPKPQDRAFADTLRASAVKFGVAILAEKEWTFNTDLRRAAGQEIPLFTQDFPDHHVLLVADEADDFARYVEHNTWLPRPVAGSDGLRSEGWAPVLEQWAAVQLQNRFEKAAKREMRSRDYAAWTALRTVGEAVTRTGSADPAALRGYILSNAFGLDGFKGRTLTYRQWNGQLRQPMAVVNARALVELAPLDGYLHQTNEMDTLGLDRPESACKAFGG
ncbi:ABC transporter substrate binding protein (PQQ-dependent alcohol dehydrogenase system) [Pseudochelatococcus lubricantis]|uniref:ABC transporter substrate binding protein (PQQ-dependent alcohol dehydrogenase system) n=1 Tax=Pseudochelatococcus lubricantis TaxID=1538102 RepID=A0ABX0V1P3_9HYPH|nr:ABC transporter substrate-binding protein [Pseudochelatococcus lubricantis]NIJ59071.1 ABC transporter substrate binding protein (PQQ-dependent alcohol dehydrogenase system) [Pseudochelatococcus lubricantis]